ncbi:hypothetical protein C8T65DRAFT_112093 [Cerioporus squamosus]|nr:hypothetical protein C8T65DRAFT_112093 [Cerioporus squamosus]
MQRFGRGARDPDLQAVAILIAEPSCFYDEHMKKEKRKEQRRLREGQTGRGKKRRRLDIPDNHLPQRPAEAQNTGASDLNALSESESESDGEDEERDEEDVVQGAVAGNSELQVETGAAHQDRAAQDEVPAVTEDILESVFMGEQQQGGKRQGKKHCRRSKPTDRALCLFLNAHALASPKRCRRYHSNIYFANNKALICCDICGPAEVAAMIPVRNDIPLKTKRAPAQAKIVPYTAAEAEDALERDLFQWRETAARSLYGDYDLYGPDMLLHFKLIGRIVDLAHARKLETVQDLEVHTRWCFARKFGDEILGVVHRHFPKQIPPSPFVSAPLTSRSRENQLSTSVSRPQLPQSPLAGRKTRALPTCSVCRILGHRKNSPLCTSRQRASALTGSENVRPRPPT